MQLIQGPRPRTRWLTLDTYTQMVNTAARYERLGYRYIIGYREAGGHFGLLVVQLTEWTPADRGSYVNLRLD